MKNKRILRSISFSFVTIIVGIMVFLSSSSFAAETQDRYAIINQELEHASGCVSENAQVTWADVCFESFEAQRSRMIRQEVINAELEYYASVANAPSPIKDPAPGSENLNSPIGKTVRDVNINEISPTQPLPPSVVDKDFIEESKPKVPGKFKLESEVYRFEYEEPGLMSDKGYMYGIAAEYTERSRDNSLDGDTAKQNKINMFRVDGRFDWGYVDYESNGTGTMDDLRNYMGEVRAVAGYDFTFANALLTPYFGGGYRYLNNDARGTSSTGHKGYLRESMYFYLPLGFDIQKRFSKEWEITLNGEYDFLVYGTQESHLNDVDSNYDPVKNHQGQGFGYRSSLEVLKQGKTVDFFFEPFIRYWSIADSEISDIVWAGWIVGYGIEPKNTTTEYGLKLGARF